MTVHQYTLFNTHTVIVVWKSNLHNIILPFYDDQEKNTKSS